MRISTRFLAWVVITAGALLTVAGVGTWILVQTSLNDERITVAEDADWLAGDRVNGPFSAYMQAETIEKHALDSSGGKTYAELDREDPARATVMNGSFLRASLFTSVVAFGVAAMAVALGIVVALVGWALLLIDRQTNEAGGLALDAPAHANAGAPSVR